MLAKLKNIHLLAWVTAAASIAVTIWTQVSPSVLPLLSAHSGQIITAFVAILAAFSPSKKQITPQPSAQSQGLVVPSDSIRIP